MGLSKQDKQILIFVISKLSNAIMLSEGYSKASKEEIDNLYKVIQKW